MDLSLSIDVVSEAEASAIQADLEKRESELKDDPAKIALVRSLKPLDPFLR